MPDLKPYRLRDLRNSFGFLCAALAAAPWAATGCAERGAASLQPASNSDPEILVEHAQTLAAEGSRKEALELLQSAYQECADVVRDKTDAQEARGLQEKMLVYLRALAEIAPDEPLYQFGIAKVHYLLGEIDQGRKIMERLAPRHRPGFAPAHVWMAERLFDARSYDDALWHLEFALAQDSKQSDVHLLMAQVYFTMCTNYLPEPLNAAQLPKNVLLDKCRRHLLESPQDNRQVQSMLGKVHALLGQKDDALRAIGSLVDDYRQVLKTKPDDIESRIRLAQSYRDVGEFGSAVEALQEGIRLKPDPKLDFELSMTFFLMADYQQRNAPNSLDQQYAALRLGYVAYPASPYVAARFAQGLVGSKEDAAAARSSLLTLIDAPAAKGTSSRGMAVFLLGFDAQQRNLVVQARRYFDDAKTITDDKIAGAVANMSLASLQRRTGMIDSATALRLTDSAISVWPENPNLQMVRGWNDLRNKNHASALNSFNKALKYRTDDPVLHTMLVETYRGLGQSENAEKHKRLAEAAKVREQAANQTKSASNTVPAVLKP
jgi:tetratricopeptide (TPR) repeat protein